jgi:hypothetical protein
MPSPSGGDARLVLGVVVVLSIGCAVWYLRRVATPGQGVRPFAVPATLALGCAAGLAAAALLAQPVGGYACFGEAVDLPRDCQELHRWISQGRPAYVAWLVALLGWVALPRRAARVLVGVAVVATPAVLWPDQIHHPAPDNVAPMTMSVLGLVALLGSAGPARRPERWGVLAAAATTVALPTVVTFTLAWTFMFPAGPMFSLALVPLAVALVSGWRLASHGAEAHRVVAAGMVTLSGAWLVVLAFDVAAYRVVGVLLVAAALFAALMFRPRPLHHQGVPQAAPIA